MSASRLFPVPTSSIASGFTTAKSLVQPVLIVNHVALSDPELSVHRVTSRTTHHLVVPPTPAHADPHSPPIDLAWEAIYPEGSINPSHDIPGGFGFYLTGPKEFKAELEKGAKEVLMSYEVMFQKDWECAKGGKLPGMFGGKGDLAYRCTGGRKEDRCSCFDFRLMWRSQGAGELYAYVPPISPNTSALLAVPPWSKQNSDYGYSVGRGSFTFSRGKWTAVAQRIKLGEGENADEIEVYIDGTSIMHVKGLSLHDVEANEVRIKGLHFQTFFGGHTPDWVSPKDQKAWFAHVSGAILQS